MECKICGSKEIKSDCQYINGDYYHNHCIEQLQQENKQLKAEKEKIEKNFCELYEEKQKLFNHLAIDKNRQQLDLYKSVIETK